MQMLGQAELQNATVEPAAPIVLPLAGNIGMYAALLWGVLTRHPFAAGIAGWFVGNQWGTWFGNRGIAGTGLGVPDLAAIAAMAWVAREFGVFETLVGPPRRNRARTRTRRRRR